MSAITRPSDATTYRSRGAGDPLPGCAIGYSQRARLEPSGWAATSLTLKPAGPVQTTVPPSTLTIVAGPEPWSTTASESSQQNATSAPSRWLNVEPSGPNTVVANGAWLPFTVARISAMNWP